jgi:hypothetical protein
LAGAAAGEWVAGDARTSFGGAAGAGGEPCEGLGVRLGLGDGLLPLVGVGELGVRVGVGEGFGEVGDGVGRGVRDGVGVGVGEVGDGVGLGVGDGVGLGVGEVGDGVGLGVGEASDDPGLEVGSRITDAAAKPEWDGAMAAAANRPRMVTRRMRATRRWLAPADLGRRNLVLKIRASKVTIATALHAANVSKQVKVNNTL